MTRVFGGLFDGRDIPNDGDFPAPELRFLVPEAPTGVVLNLDRTPHPDGPISIKVRYELAKTLSGRLVYVPLDFYATKEERPSAGEPGDDTGGYQA